MALLYATASMALGVADLFTGSIERVGERIRTGSFDGYLIRPVPAFLQTAADGFALRRLGRPLQAASLFSASDPDGDALSYYLYDNSPDPSSGHFVVDGVAVPAPLDELTVAPSKEAATRIVLKEYHQFRRGAGRQENTARILLAVLGVCAMN
jgi:hypothetical protein